MAPTQTFKLSADTVKAPTNSVILITGAAAGLGLATAKFLHEPRFNNKLILLDLSPPSDPDLSHSSRVQSHQLDIRSWTSQRDAFAAGAKKFGGIDHVFINAGINEYKNPFFDEDLDKDGNLKEMDRRTLDVDLNAAVDTLKLAIYYLRNDRRKQKGGSIVLTASLAGYLATGGAVLYSAAKHGIVGLFRALKNDVKSVGINISVMAPGITLTNIVAGRPENQSLEEWGKEKRAQGVPINVASTIALGVAYLMGSGKEGHGVGLLVQENVFADVEKGIVLSRKEWMGEEMLKMFRGGRTGSTLHSNL